MPKKETKSEIKLFYHGGTKVHSALVAKKSDVEIEIRNCRQLKTIAKLETVHEQGDDHSEHIFFDPNSAQLLFWVIEEKVEPVVEAPKTDTVRPSGLVIPAGVPIK